MNQIEEYIWLLEILSELKSYSNHNTRVIEEVLSVVRYRLECLEKTLTV